MGFLLWILAVILVVVGVVQLIQGQIIFGIILIIVGLAIGPGGYSIFNRRRSASDRRRLPVGTGADPSHEGTPARGCPAARPDPLPGPPVLRWRT